MKLIIVMMTVCLMQVSAATHAQEVTLKQNGVKLKRAFTEIRKQTGYTVLCQSEVVDKAKPVDLDLEKVPLDVALKEILKGQNLEYVIKNKAIFISEKERPSFLERIIGAFTVIDISAKVINAEGSPLSGASVKVKGTGKTVNTNAQGIFHLNGVAYDAILVISFIGYEVQEIKASELAHSGQVVLKENIGKLDETVIIGYGTTTQRLNTGSVSSVKGEDIARQPVENPISALQGRMTGVFVTDGVGLPGSSVKVQIRGINSISGGKDPLYIVDGVPFSSQGLNEWNGFLFAANGASSPFNAINPTDIERIDVLKDADATAIYGSRAANGVVLITTKRGQTGDTKFDVNLYSGILEATKMTKTLNTEQYLGLRKIAFANDGVIPTPGNSPELTVFDQRQYTDFQKYSIGNQGKVTDAQLNISGGNEYVKFSLGGNYRTEGTIYPGNLGYHRGGAHLNLDHHSVDKKFTATVGLNFTSDDNRNIATTQNYTYVPNAPLYDSNGNFDFNGAGSLAASTLQKSWSKTKSLITNGVLGYNITTGLNLKTNLGYNNTQNYTLMTFPKNSINPRNFNPVNKANYGNNSMNYYLIEPQFDYVKDLGSGKLQALLAGTWQHSTTYGSFISGEDYPNDGLLGDINAAGRISNYIPKTTNSSEYKYVSVFSRINYNWKNRYIINASIRRDGSSRFGPGKEFGTFGAMGLAWLFSNEKLIENLVPTLSFGKLRGSFGVVGNDQIADYGYLATYGPSSQYQGSTGLLPWRIANPDYSWERNKKLETGLDLGFFKDRILINVAWFRTRSDNQLVGYTLPTQTGFKSYQANLPALVENKGWEFALNTINVKTRTFNWQSSFNFTTLSNKLLAFPSLSSAPYMYSSNYVVGESLNLIKGFHFLGVDPQTGIPKFSTAAGGETNTPSSATDRVIIGQTLPKFYGGLNNSFTYQGIQLDFLLQFVKQDGYFPNYWPGASGFVPMAALDYWKNPGDITDQPKPTSRNANNAASNSYSAYMNSDRFFGDASYIRLKNVSISYSLPTKWLQKVKIKQLRLYFHGQNLLTLTKYKGVDPEVPGKVYGIPPLKIMTIGVQSTF